MLIMVLLNKNGGAIMPTWSQLLKELQPYKDDNGNDVPGISLDNIFMTSKKKNLRTQNVPKLKHGTIYCMIS